MVNYEDENLDQIISPEFLHSIPKIISIIHDELVFYANNDIVKT